MATNFTVQQQKAILARGKNVIVSAGAGSGKTAVLTERVFRLVADEHVPINHLLVLTFTNAAAHEMKMRIKNRLRKDEKTKNLANEIENAQITTFDAYAYFLVRKYHYLLDLDTDVSIIEENYISVTKQHYLEVILQNYYETRESRWVNLIANYTVKNDQPIRDLIFNFDRLIDLKIDERTYLENYLTTHFSDDFFTESITDYLKICSEYITIIHNYMNQIDNPKEAKKIYEFSERYLAFNDTTLTLNALRNYDGTFPRKTNDLSENDKNLHDAINEAYKELKKYADLGTIAQIKQRYLATKDSIDLIVEITTKLRNKMLEYKRKHNVFTFNDIAKMALSLLDYQQVQDEIRAQMQYIMIDEYQDTSDLQEAFLQKIANHNLYMVGDIKQSIYRFRHANSAIFREKYTAYQSGENGLCIDMNENFRSRKEVINDINAIFSNLMSIDYGGADYRATHQIIFANQAYQTHGQIPQNSALEALVYDAKNSVATSTLSRQEKEGIIISDKIAQLVESGFLVFPKGANHPRPIQYQDIAILVDRKTNFEFYQNALQARQIPIKVHQERTVTTAHVTQVLRSLINLLCAFDDNEVDSKKSRHSFLSIARSYLYQLPDDETYHALLEPKTFLHHPLMLKMHDFCENTRNLPLKNRIERIIQDFDLIAKLPLIGEVQANLYLLNALVSAAGTLEKLDYSMKNFSDYFQSITDFGLEFSIPDYLAPENAVQLMSIHKSKGLEYPVVFYCGLASRFNVSDLRTAFFTDDRYGVQLPNIDESGVPSLFRYLVTKKEMQAEISEKIRLLYVALTRAREKIYLVLPRPSDDYQKPLSQASCLADFIYLWDQFADRTILIDKFLSHAPQLLKSSLSQKSPDNIPIKQYHFEFKEQKAFTFSKTLSSDSQPEYLHYGEQLHYLLSLVDFASKDLSFITDEKQQMIIQKIVNLDLFAHIQQGQVYQEYPFYDDDTESIGIIDGFIIHDDYICLFDYKLRRINDVAYDQQVIKYARYLANIFHKPMKAYLISILTGQYRAVELPKEIA